MAYVLGRRKPNLTFPTLTGSIVTFNSQYEGLPLKSCKVNIPVTQEGTGDPSPENVRNFVGFSSLDFTANSVIKTFQFGQTIYAGELDILKGIFTATHVYLHITTVNVMNSQRANVGVGGNRTIAVQLDQNELRCNILKSETFSSALDNHIHFSNVQTLQLYMAEEIGTTVAEWETWLSDHPLYVCYKLETPKVINLGGMDISTLQGENNLFASTGNTTAQYIKIGG